jgi:predicted RNA-binding Zn ribbon-like protein
MDFIHYASRAMDLLNADLSSVGDLQRHLSGRPWLVERIRVSDPASLRRFQRRLAAVADASAAGDGAQVVALLNGLLARHAIHPRISGHDAGTWHLHVSDTDASVADTLAAEALFGLILLVTEMGATRLGRCSAAGCHQAFVDTSTNGSRRFCSGRCATRTNVANYRQRRNQSPA